jgi:hypothetical protein
MEYEVGMKIKQTYHIYEKMSLAFYQICYTDLFDEYNALWRL